MSRLRRWARALRQQSLVVYFAARDPRTPWPTRLLALGVAAYAASPIDLIPDFIPVIGYLDDLFIVPLGVALGATTGSGRRGAIRPRKGSGARRPAHEPRDGRRHRGDLAARRRGDRRVFLAQDLLIRASAVRRNPP